MDVYHLQYYRELLSYSLLFFYSFYFQKLLLNEYQVQHPSKLYYCVQGILFPNQISNKNITIFFELLIKNL